MHSAPGNLSVLDLGTVPILVGSGRGLSEKRQSKVASCDSEIGEAEEANDDGEEDDEPLGRRRGRGRGEGGI